MTSAHASPKLVRHFEVDRCSKSYPVTGNSEIGCFFRAVGPAIWIVDYFRSCYQPL